MAPLTAAFRVRCLETGDVPVLKTLLPDWTPEHWKPGPPDSAPSVEHQFRVLVGDAGQLAGIAEYQQIVDEAHLLGIAIVPALQRSGLGMQLLMAVLGEMRAQGCLRCLLEVRRSNVAAQMLYERAGFTRDGIRRAYYPPLDAGQREDALLYSRVL